MGHTLYMLCSHNAQTGVDLPMHIRFLDARRHDSVSAIVSLREFRTLSPLTKTAPRCVWQASVWSTGDTAGRSILANGAAHWPAVGWLPAHAEKHVLHLLMAVVSIQNQTGTSVSTPLFQEGQQNIRRFTITVLPVRG